MTLDEAVAEFEAGFTVHTEVGFDTGREAVGLDRGCAPCGEPYVMIVSGAIKRQGECTPIWYAFEDDAIDAWLAMARVYAEGQGRHLYWCERPRWEPREFVALDQAGMIGDPRARADIVLKVGVVYSRLVVTNLLPDGTEDAVV